MIEPFERYMEAATLYNFAKISGNHKGKFRNLLKEKFRNQYAENSVREVGELDDDELSFASGGVNPLDFEGEQKSKKQNQ